MAPGLVWQDSGEAQVRAALDDWRGSFEDRRGTFPLARSHALYFMLVSAVRHGLDVEPARAANFVSVLGGSVTVANIAALLWMILGHRLAACAAAAMLALSHTLWQFSAMAECNSLVAAFLSAELLVVALLARSGSGKWIRVLGLLNGLAAANHNLALLSAACYVLIGVFTLRRWPGAYLRDLLMAGLLWLAGFAPMLAMMAGDLRAGDGPGVVLRSVLVGPYVDEVFNLRFGVADVVRFVGMVGLNFPTPLLLCAGLGWAGLRSRVDRRLCWTYALLLAAHATFVIRYNVADQFSFMIPTCVLLTVFTGAGIDRLLARREARIWNRRGVSAGRRWTRVLIVLLAVPSPLVYAILPHIVRGLPPERVPIPMRPVPYRDPYDWFLRPWRAGYRGAERFAAEALAVLPPRAVVISDTTLRPPILYLQNHDGLRHDVRIGFGTLQPFLEYRRIRGDELRPFVEQGRLYSLAGQARYMGGDRWIADEYRLERAGPIYRVVSRSPD